VRGDELQSSKFKVQSRSSENRTLKSEGPARSASDNITAVEKTELIGPKSHEEVIERFRKEGFRIGPHKAFQIARDSVGRRLLMVTEMPSEFARSLLLVPCAGMDEAMSSALKDLQPGARVGVMPFANATIPSMTSAAFRQQTSGESG
jgi:hypothetical protein